MSLNLALLILLLLIVLYITFIEIFTVIFMLTGMSHSRSSFQVISLLTNSGFTTSESEVVVSSRKRRKIAITVMIFGHMFNVAIVSLLVNLILSISKDKSFDVIQGIIKVILLLLFIILIKRLSFIRVAFDKLVKRIATRVMFSKGSNSMLILDNFYGFVIVEVKVSQVPEILENKSLIESRISKDHGIKILTIKRNDRTLTDIRRDDIIMNNDRLIIYGPLKNIMEVFKQRPSHYGAQYVEIDK